MKIAMIGGGYVGLVSAACLASFGYEVVCVERDSERLKLLEQRRVPFFEPGLERLLEEVLDAQRLHFSADALVAVRDCAIVFIAVGTPSRRADFGADISDVRDALKEITPALQQKCTVVMKSTVPVGTSDEIESLIAQTRPDLDFDVVANPEFLRQGEAIEDFIRPERVVVGVNSERAQAVMESLYHPFALNETPVLFTDRRTAEISKYAANGFLAAKIAMIDEIADLCEVAGADVETVAHIIGSDARIAPGCLRPGPGFGGSCFPKDTKALLSMAQTLGVRIRTIEATIEANTERKRNMATKIINAAGGSIHGKTVGVLGVTFKPETDDMRESPSLDILPALRDAGATVQAFDPHGMKSAARLIDDIDWKEDCYAALDGADIAIILTEWKEFRSLDFSLLRQRMNGNILVDLRNIYRAEDVVAAGFQYHSVGRAPMFEHKSGANLKAV
ncbi:MAG: UDP-glucose/GDP-mannose dehydrogenase family protein [Hyphomicrobiales bacterium]|nr:UDP-glucose/GDP-mannose dehydrogenase family protein [Hyphomicrobiales bacterium]